MMLWSLALSMVAVSVRAKPIVCDPATLGPPTLEGWASGIQKDLAKAATSEPVGVKNLCETEEKREGPCPAAPSRIEAELAEAKARGEKVIFIFGSERCGPCRAWKKSLEGQGIRGVRVVYLPLSYGRRSTDDPHVKKACQGAMTRFAVSSAGLPAGISGYPACLRKPTLFIVDPGGLKGVEIDPGLVKGAQPAALVERLERLATTL